MYPEVGLAVLNLTHRPQEMVILDQQLDDVGGLGCHGYLIHVSGGKADEEVWGDHHGNIGQVHLVGGGMLRDLLKKLEQPLSSTVIIISL